MNTVPLLCWLLFAVAVSSICLVITAILREKFESDDIASTTPKYEVPKTDYPEFMPHPVALRTSRIVQPKLRQISVGPFRLRLI